MSGLFVAAASVASAAGPVTAVPAGPESVVVTNFADYPSIVPPAGCTAGAGFLTGVSYDVVRGPAGLAAGKVDVFGATTLRETGPVGNLYPGDKVIAHWTGFTGGEGCDGESIGVSLALKESSSPTFDANDEQALLRDFAYCGTPAGPEGQAVASTTSCADTNNTLTLTMPGGNIACFYQIDLVIGGPLANVGPSGSYYGNSLRVGAGKKDGPDMLIDANNGGNPCEDTTTTTEGTTTTTEGTTTTTEGTTTTTQGTTTTTEGTTTTTQGTTTTTQATTTTAPTTTVVNTTQETSTTLGTTTTAPTTTAATTTTGATTTINRATPPPDVTVEGTTVTNPETLPVTGSTPWGAARIGVLMVLAGAAALALSRRKGAEA